MTSSRFNMLAKPRDTIAKVERDRMQRMHRACVASHEAKKSLEADSLCDVTGPHTTLSVAQWRLHAE